MQRVTSANLGNKGDPDSTENESTIKNVVSPTRQRVVIIALVAVAFGALFTASKFSAPTEPSAVVFTGSAADGGGTRDDAANGETPLSVSPVEGWLPASGDGVACSERVGIDLIPGYGATLEINGVSIAEEDMNNYVAPGQALDAGASIGEFTWGPEEDCPFGTILRPTDNRVIACVYRFEEGPENCTSVERPGGFDF